MGPRLDVVLHARCLDTPHGLERHSAAQAEYDRSAAQAWSPRPLKSPRSNVGRHRPPAGSSSIFGGRRFFPQTLRVLPDIDLRRDCRSRDECHASRAPIAKSASYCGAISNANFVIKGAPVLVSGAVFDLKSLRRTRGETGSNVKFAALVWRRNGDDLLAGTALVEPPSGCIADPGQRCHEREFLPASGADRLVRLVVAVAHHRN